MIELIPGTEQIPNRNARRRYVAIMHKLRTKARGDSNPARAFPLSHVRTPDNCISYTNRRAIAQTTLTTSLAA